MTNNSDQRFDIYNTEGERVYKNVSYDAAADLYHWRDDFGFIPARNIPKGWEIRPI